MSPLIRIGSLLNHTKNFIIFVKKNGGRKAPRESYEISIFLTEETKSTKTEGISSVVSLSSQRIVKRS